MRPACGVRQLIALSYPESEEGEYADTEGQADETFGDRSETAESEAAGVVRVLDLGRHVLHDVVDLGVTEVAGEARHVGGAGANRLGDFDRGDLAQRRRERAHGQRVAVAFDGVARRAVEREERRAVGDVRVLQVRIGNERVARRRASSPTPRPRAPGRG